MFNGDTPISTHSHSDIPPSSEVATTRQTDGAAHKLKPRSFHKSAHLRVHSVDFHPGVNRAWQPMTLHHMTCHMTVVLYASLLSKRKIKEKEKENQSEKIKEKKIKIVNIQASYNMLRDLNMEMTSLMNFSSSLLFLGIMSLKDWTNSSVIEIVIVRDTWSNISYQPG